VAVVLVYDNRCKGSAFFAVVFSFGGGGAVVFSVGGGSGAVVFSVGGGSGAVVFSIGGGGAVVVLLVVAVVDMAIVAAISPKIDGNGDN